MDDGARRTQSDYELRKLHARFGTLGFDSSQASKALKSLSTEELTRLAEIEVQSLRGRLSRVSIVFSAIFGAAVLAFVIASLISRGAEPTLPLVMLLIGLGSLVSSTLFRPARDPLAEVVAAGNDAKFVPAALTLLYGGSIRKPFTRTSGPAEHALVEYLENWLPYIDVIEAGSWPKAQKAGLLRILEDPFFNVDLTMGALGVLPYIGDRVTARSLETFASRMASWRSEGRFALFARPVSVADAARLGDAATEAHKLLDARLSAAAVPDRLLRPVEATASETLLRAPANAVTLEEETLLRPVAGDE